jgi:hypothetical protein
VTTELFSKNLATTTVSSGGTDAPASGATETWTVASSAMFGTATTGVSQFHVADPAANTEMIAVTNVSGTAWTVTRGAESTTPVAHSAGFTVYQVTTAGFLGAVLKSAAGSVSVPLVMVPPPSGDTSGATDQAAIQALENAADSAGAILVFAPGTYYVTGLTKQAATIWQGAGRFATVIQLASSADTDVVQGASFSTLTLSGSVTGGIGGWGIRDLTIDGNKSEQSGTSYGLRVYGYNFDLSNVSIRNCLTDPLYTEWGNGGGPSVTDKCMEARYYGLKLHDSGGNGWHNRGPHDSRAYDVTIFSNGTSDYGYWAEIPYGGCEVASGSNGINVSTFTGSGTLNVNSTLGFPSASINSTQGSITVVTSGTNAVITYTGTTATTFTGCTTVSGSGTLATNNAVTPTGGGYAGTLCLLEQVHVYDFPLWSYVLDAVTHLDGCIGEVSSGSGGMALIRTGNCSIDGGAYFVLGGVTQNGCGIQIGDTANAPGSTYVHTTVSNLAGTSAATAPLNLANDGGGANIDIVVYQPSGSTILGGTVNNASRYRVTVNGQGAATDATLGVDQGAGAVSRYLPAISSAWQLRNTTGSGTGADIMALNMSGTPATFNHVEGTLDKWWAGAYITETVRIDGGNGFVQPGTSAGRGAHVYSGAGAPNISASVEGDIYIRTDNGTRSFYVATGSNTWSTLQPADLPAGTTSAQGALQLDGTASDIAALGQLGAGASGLAADAKHVHPAPDALTALPGSAIAWNYPAWAAASAAAPTQTAGTSGSLYFLKIYLPYAATITNLNFLVQTAGSGATVDAAYAGLCNSSGTVVATSANRSSDSALTSGAPSVWTAPLSGTYAAAAGTYYALLLIYMNSGGTNPSLACMTNGKATTVGQSSGSYPVSQLTGQTGIAGPYTLTSNATTSNYFQVTLT